jgi:hypothetical protein
MQNAKEKSRGLLRRPDRVVQDLLSGYSDDVEPSQGHAETGARTSRIFTYRSRRPGTANKIVRNRLGERDCDARDRVEYRNLLKNRPSSGKSPRLFDGHSVGLRLETERRYCCCQHPARLT